MMQTDRVPTGIAGFDGLVEGGLPKGRSILITGEPGTGKTIFSLQFLFEGLLRGERGIYVAADEEPMDILEQAASLGWNLEEYVEKKEFAILNAGAYLSSVSGASKDRQIDIHKAIGDLARFGNQLEAKRLVLDPAGPFVLLRDTATRIQDQTRLLIKLLRTSMPTTNVLTSYAVPRTGEMTMHGVEEYLTAGVLVFKMLSKNGQLTRNLILEKMRCTDAKPVQHEFDIVKGKGIVLLENA
ncbi:MAG: ATPase domain-containing protein [Deltaproteobacteria bacterium]|nr:ATPase domain-containing protein [Deltaproteobacteria bacterium]MDZ4341056.1 ATPase domain-containing protein [Candidatus Binatia bacterium]